MTYKVTNTRKPDAWVCHVNEIDTINFEETDIESINRIYATDGDMSWKLSRESSVPDYINRFNDGKVISDNQRLLHERTVLRELIPPTPVDHRSYYRDDYPSNIDQGYRKDYYNVHPDILDSSQGDIDDFVIYLFEEHERIMQKLELLDPKKKKGYAKLLECHDRLNRIESEIERLRNHGILIPFKYRKRTPWRNMLITAKRVGRNLLSWVQNHLEIIGGIVAIIAPIIAVIAHRQTSSESYA